MENIIVQNLCKSYGGNKIFDNVSFSVEKGMTVGIIGASGIGKTTLLRLMLGLENADSGSVNGVGRASAVFQENRLLEKMSAVDNVALVLNGKKAAVQQTEIERQLTMLLPLESIYQPIKELSGGMQRRVAIVRAFMADSDTIFLDEPFTGLDRDNKSIVYEYINNNKNNRTIFVVTHDEADLKALNADICLLTSGCSIATILRNCE